VMSEVQKPGLRDFIEAEMQANNGPPLRLLTAADLATAPASSNEVRVLLDGNVIAVSRDIDLLRSISGRIRNAPATSGNLYLQRISNAYREGAGLLFTADLERIASLGPQKVLSKAGANSVKYLVFEQKDIAGKTENRAVVNFNGARQGIASWLAAPAPMGSLSFVSGEATVAASFVVKNPSLLLDDLIAMASAENPKFQPWLADLEARLGIHFREDLANTFGSDITIALDGPMLPTPSWKASVEVNDPVRLQQTIERLIVELNIEAKQHGKQGVVLDKTQSNGRTVYVIRSLDQPGFEPAYSFVDGYLVVASGTPVLNRAMRIHDNGGSLNHSQRFTSLMPTDGQTNFSAVVYYNLSKIADSVNTVVDATQAVTPQQKQAIQELADSTKPTLIYAYGQADQIQIASTGTILGLGLDNVLATGGLNAIFQRRLPGTLKSKASYK
jgi:hypothetical protein